MGSNAKINVRPLVSSLYAYSDILHFTNVRSSSDIHPRNKLCIFLLKA